MLIILFCDEKLTHRYTKIREKISIPSGAPQKYRQARKTYNHVNVRIFPPPPRGRRTMSYHGRTKIKNHRFYYIVRKNCW